MIERRPDWFVEKRHITYTGLSEEGKSFHHRRIFWPFDIECRECSIVQIQMNVEPASYDCAEDGDEKELSCAKPARFPVLNKYPEDEQKDRREDKNPHCLLNTSSPNVMPVARTSL